MFWIVVPYTLNSFGEKQVSDRGLKYNSCVISKFGSVNVVFDGYPQALTIRGNTHKCYLERISPRIVFELDMLFQGKKDAFLRNIANKHCVINAISTGIRKAGCNALHSHDDADIDIIKLALQSFLK